MKWILGLMGLTALLLTGGCAVESGYGYGGAYGVYGGEYPYTYYGSSVHPYGYAYPRYRHWHPYDRDHYWDRHRWERRHWDDDHRWH